MKIRSVGAELFHEDMIKPAVTFRRFAKALKNSSLFSTLTILSKIILQKLTFVHSCSGDVMLCPVSNCLRNYLSVGTP